MRTPDKQVWAVSFIRQVNKRDLILKAEIFGTASNMWLALRTLPAGHTLDIKSVKKEKDKKIIISIGISDVKWLKPIIL